MDPSTLFHFVAENDGSLSFIFIGKLDSKGKEIVHRFCDTIFGLKQVNMTSLIIDDHLYIINGIEFVECMASSILPCLELVQ